MEWVGNTGSGTTTYKSYSRNFEVQSEGKSIIQGSSDPAFLGDKSRYNPEDMLVASLSSCHMLWYLHLCTTQGIIVESYVDEPTGIMLEDNNGNGHFTEVTLFPKIKIKNIEMKDKAIELHHKAHDFCFIANSVNFPVYCKPVIE